MTSPPASSRPGARSASATRVRRARRWARSTPTRPSAATSAPASAATAGAGRSRPTASSSTSGGRREGRRMSFDLIIKGGTVVDGAGLPMRRADVGIRLGLITDIGRLSGARKTLDGDGLVVMPGIIDVHTHYDPQLTFDPYATSSCFHGVTSVVAGNCG